MERIPKNAFPGAATGAADNKLSLAISRAANQRLARPLQVGGLRYNCYAIRNQTYEYRGDCHRCNPKPRAGAGVITVCSRCVWRSLVVHSLRRSPTSRTPVALYLEGGLVEVGAEVSEPFTGNDRVH